MRKNILITGTLILTAAGFASRFIGFFYRIFLSRMFSTEQMGIYELINPILALTYALCISGIQNAVSRFCAARSEHDQPRKQLQILLAGLLISCVLSTVWSIFVYRFSDRIARNLLQEERCAPLLRIIALSFPAACVHACINGYFYGIRKTGLPAVSQLLEQIFRVGSVFIFWQYHKNQQIPFSISMAALGTVIGEMASALFSVLFTFRHFTRKQIFFLHPVSPKSLCASGLLDSSRELLCFALPLSLNRICLNLLSTAEAAWIPTSLEQFGLTTAQALSVYATLTGMAMTCIFFPGALTNSISVLLMPLIAKAHACRDDTAIKNVIGKCSAFCLFMGICCWALFFFTGPMLGKLFFKNVTAGEFIRILSFLCPVLYLNSALYSVQNGLGKTGLTFLCSLCALGIRLFFVVFLIPVHGISGYLAGLMISQVFISCFHYCSFARYFKKS